MGNPSPPEEPETVFERAGLSRWTSARPLTVNRYLLPHEDLVITTRQHPAVLIGPVILSLAGVVVATILSRMVPRADQSLVVAIWAGWAVLVLRTFVKVSGWAVGEFVITSERVLFITGVFTRRIYSIPLGLIDDISVRRSPGARLFGYGELVVRSGHQKQVRQRIQYVAYPDELARRMDERRFPAGEISP
jgi:uncharacterized membrane protein YdbT with pleckstrin-like domain